MLFLGVDPVTFSFGLLPVIAAPAAFLALVIGYSTYRGSLGFWTRWEDDLSRDERVRAGRWIALGVAVAVLLLGLGIWAATRPPPGPTIIGSEVEAELRRQLTPAEGSDLLTDTLDCPDDERVGDSDIIRCEIQRSDHGPATLEVEVLRRGSGWYFEIGVDE
jgi:hypothetical protein